MPSIAGGSVNNKLTRSSTTLSKLCSAGPILTVLPSRSVVMFIFAARRTASKRGTSAAKIQAIVISAAGNQLTFVESEQETHEPQLVKERAQRDFETRRQRFFCVASERQPTAVAAQSART